MNRRVAKGSDVRVMTCAFAIVSRDAMFIEIEPRRNLATDLISQRRARGRGPRGRRECEHSLETFLHPAHATSRAWSRAVCAHSSRARRRNATRPEICAPRTPGQDDRVRAVCVFHSRSCGTGRVRSRWLRRASRNSRRGRKEWDTSR